LVKVETVFERTVQHYFEELAELAAQGGRPDA
jgi:hypothetical protein